MSVYQEYMVGLTIDGVNRVLKIEEESQDHAKKAAESWCQVEHGKLPERVLVSLPTAE